jgi:hypothetical protein
MLKRSSVLSGSMRNSKSDRGAMAEFGAEMVVIFGTVTVGRLCGDWVRLVAAEPAEVLGSSTLLLKGEKLPLAEVSGGG